MFWSILNQLSFTQLITVPTRGQRTLDAFITNVPNYWKKTKVVKSLVRSDHDMVITYPRHTVKAKKNKFLFQRCKRPSQIGYTSGTGITGLEYDYFKYSKRRWNDFEILWKSMAKIWQMFPFNQGQNIITWPSFYVFSRETCFKTRDGGRKAYKREIPKLVYD